MSSTKIAVHSRHPLSDPEIAREAPTGSRSPVAALDRAQLRERLHSLRPVVPTFAEELEIARRQATRLCTQNRRVLEEVRRLQKQRGAASSRGSSRGGRDRAAE